ncbi:hypothetical protein FSP39_003753 [Pinctada imbricata]|uniref:Reverse transcriptase domain-containing protein n=1 Tax=Pinctada imbricata TaxID=66713 RepID=A0AA88Y292_PINIB|nr:hypothetical protein FSP39_003753 [Pinctada imbricata]
MLLIYSLNNLITEPTRVSNNSATCIDPIFVSDEIENIESGVINTDNQLTDHFATYCSLNLISNVPQSFRRDVWLYNQANFDQLKNDLHNTEWGSILNDTDIDVVCQNFNNKLKEVVLKHIPKKSVIIRGNDRPWFNSTIRKEIRLRDRFRKKYISTKSQQHKYIYKQQRNKVNNLKKILKEKFIINLDDNIDEIKSRNPKLYWSIIRTLLKGTKPSQTLPPLNSENGLVFSDSEKCDLLNEYFCKISSLENDDKTPPSFDERTEIHVPNITVTEQEIKDIIDILDINKASGPDEFSHRLIKNIRDEIVTPLVIIFNKSLQTGKFPIQWKHANVIPVHKKGSKSDTTNYRPISLLSCIGKIFERVMFKHFYNHLNSNKLLHNMQSGFLPGHSTTFQLIDIYHHICLALDHKEYLGFTFCDISKAFDRVWIKGLIHKLNAYGFKGEILKWISSYLTNRSQQVILNQCSSTIGRPTAGVPQGSVLGPLFFLVFINDLPDAIEGLSRLYADDTSVSHSSSSLSEIERNTNLDMTNITKWSKDWLVEFNPAKTKVLVFGADDNELENLTFIFDNIPINPVHSHKHLGITFDNNGKWTSHIDDIVTKVSKLIAVFRKIKYKLNRNTLNKMYLTFIRPHLEYACEVWDNITINDSNRLEKLQNEAARIVTGLPKYCSLNSLYSELSWETLKKRREKQKLGIMYKIKNGLVPDYLSDILPPEVHENTPYNLRNSHNIQQLNTRLNLYKNSFFPATIKLWNDLPLDTRNSTSINTFKRKLYTNIYLPPKHYSYGNRLTNIHHTRLRHGCSSLNAHLFKYNISTSDRCNCGETETSKHFFLDCKLYDNIRLPLISAITQNEGTVNMSTILCGDETLSLSCNTRIVNAVQTFIKQSKRFS